jgi:bacterioferritin
MQIENQYLRHLKMKQKKKLIAVLNSLLIDKLTTVNQFISDSEMCENLGYTRLHEAIQKLATDQMLHAEWLIERIKFLDGSATLSKLNSVMIGKTVSGIMSHRNNPETLRAHNDAIELAQEADDYTTADLLYTIVDLEKSSTDWDEILSEQLEKKGPENYLVTEAENQVN